MKENKRVTPQKLMKQNRVGRTFRPCWVKYNPITEKV